ncbi:MAG: rhodanese-like domain-containing protein [Verrucomicrobiota bacterium]
MGRSLLQVVVILVLGSALGLLANAISPKRIPLQTPPKQAPRADEFIPLDQAQRLWSEGTSFFIDARKPADYEAGHIANALNLPVEAFGEHYPRLAPMLTPESQLIVYCDGTECELSHRLASELQQQGYTNVHVLFNGWTAWRSAHLPVEQGAGK